MWERVKSYKCIKRLIIVVCFQVQEKFALHLTDEEAVAYLQGLIDESVTAIMAALVEQIHKMAQVSHDYLTLYHIQQLYRRIMIFLIVNPFIHADNF